MSADERDVLLDKILIALNTPPFLIPTRVVVVRSAFLMGKADTEKLVAWTQNPVPGVTLIVTGKGTKTSPLVKAADRVVDVNVSTRAKDVPEYVRTVFEKYGVKADTQVVRDVAEFIGEEVERVDPLARTLSNIYGTAPLRVEHVTPYLGDKGNVPEWDLTDAVDQGDTAKAVSVVHRMLASEGREPVQIVGIFERHYMRCAKLLRSEVRSQDEAAKLLATNGRPLSPFTASKIMKLVGLLGADRLGHALTLVGQADRDVKGETKLDGEAVVEILAARLARLSETARRQR